MIYYLFIAACILTFIAFKKQDARSKDDKTISHFFWKNSFEFLVPFLIVMLIYIVLVLVVSRASDTASLRFLIRLEEILATIKSYAYFKLSAVTVLICFAVLYLLGFLRFTSAEKRKKLYSRFDMYRKWSKRAYIFLVLLCSLTLFGTQFGKPASDLNIRIKTIRDGYADLQREAEEVVSQEVTRQLFDKVRDNLPQSYPQAFALSDTVNAKTKALTEAYSKAQSDYGIKVPEAEAILKEYPPQKPTGLVTELKVSEAKTVTAEPRAANQKMESAKVAEPDLDRLSYERVERAKSALQGYKQKIGSGVIRLYKSEGGKEIILQIPKVTTSNLKKSLFSEIIKLHPLTEALFDTVFDTLDDTVKSKMEKRFNEAAKSVINNPSDVQRAVNNEAAKIVGETDVRVLPQTTAKAEQARSRLENALATVDDARARTDKVALQAENNRIGNLIAQLSNPKESVREESTRTLTSTGDKLSQAHVNQLVGIMKRGGQRWSVFLRRESHCSWYEYTSVKYYAASVLEDVKSPFVSAELAREASRVRSNGKNSERVTDPGWI